MKPSEDLNTIRAIIRTHCIGRGVVLACSSSSGNRDCNRQTVSRGLSRIVASFWSFTWLQNAIREDNNEIAHGETVAYGPAWLDIQMFKNACQDIEFLIGEQSNAFKIPFNKASIYYCSSKAFFQLSIHYIFVFDKYIDIVMGTCIYLHVMNVGADEIVRLFMVITKQLSTLWYGHECNSVSHKIDNHPTVFAQSNRGSDSPHFSIQSS